MKKLRLAGCIAVIVTIVMLLPMVSLGQDNSGVWSPPLRLGTGWWQSMTVDRQGRLHIGWYDVFKLQTSITTDATVDADILRYTSRGIDGQWTIPNDVQYTGIGGFTVRNSLAATSDGMLHAVFRANTLHRFSSAYAPLASNAGSWSVPSQVDNFGYYITLFADNRDVLHIAYNGRIEGVELQTEGSLERIECGGCGDVIYMRSTDGGRSWSTVRALTDTVNSSSEKMDFYQGANGRVYLQWDEGYDWYQGRGRAQDVRILYSDDNGITWSDPIILDGGEDERLHPVQLASTEMPDGTLLAVWRNASDEDTSVYYQTSTDFGLTWTEPQPIPGLLARIYGDTPLDDYELITDETGGAHLFAVGYTEIKESTNPSLYHLVYRQGLWLPPQRIMYSAKLRPEWPKAHLGLQNDIHLTWFTRGIDEKAGFIEADSYKQEYLNVYYSHMESNFALQPTLEFNATYTPIPSPTPFQVLDPTLTPFPTIEVEVQTGFVATQDQYATETLFGGIGAAMAFCVVVILLVRLRRP